MTPITWLLLATHVPANGSGGGIVRYTVELATHLERHPEVELHVLTVASARDFFVRLLGDPQRVRSLPDLPTPALSVLESYGFGTRGKFDVVHGTKHVVPARGRAHKVLTVHDMLLVDRPTDYPLIKRLLLRPSYRRAIRIADSVVCVSRSTEDRLGALSPNSHAVSTAVPLAVSDRLRESAPVPLAEVDGLPFALVVGDTSPRKNVSLIVDCWDQVLTHEPEARLVIVGPPSWGRTVVGKEFARLVDAGRLVAAGHLDEGQLRWCYENATVVLCPSLAEGFGLPAAEAMSFGAPVITSQDPALQEVTGATARHLSATDRDGWAAAIVEAFANSQGHESLSTARSWREVADETVTAVRRDMHKPPPYRAILTHHWLIRRRGGEKVLEALAELVPAAPIYTIVHDPGWAGHAGSTSVDSRSIHHSPLQLIPGSRKHYPKLLPLMPLAARMTRLPHADLVLCSDACLAKAMKSSPSSRVVCYCHSPMRYVWDPAATEQYLSVLPRAVRPLWRLLAPYLRRADRKAARRVDEFIANSATVAERIRRAYGRESTVIHPPIDLPAVPWTADREDHYLCVGHHVTYKRLDLAIEASRRLGSRLVVIGDGPDVARLRSSAGPTVTFLGYQEDAVVHDHYRRARALLFPGEEDFGIVPVEAMARGCPVIAYAGGGALETVTAGVTGWFFDDQTPESLAQVMSETSAIRLDPVRMHAAAAKFGRARFDREMRAILHRAPPRAQRA